jgi:hypothetical protein
MLARRQRPTRVPDNRYSLGLRPVPRRQSLIVWRLGSVGSKRTGPLVFLGRSHPHGSL